VIAETEDDLIKRLNEWKYNLENRGMRVNMNKTKVMISGEWQKVMQKAVRYPCGVCGRGIGNNPIQYTSCQKLHRVNFMILESCWSKTSINTLFCRLHDNIAT